MKTTMVQNRQELASNLAQFSHFALTDKEMVKLFGGTSTSGSDGSTTTETKQTTTTTDPDPVANNDSTPPVVKED